MRKKKQNTVEKVPAFLKAILKNLICMFVSPVFPDEFQQYHVAGGSDHSDKETVVAHNLSELASHVVSVDIADGVFRLEKVGVSDV